MFTKKIEVFDFLTKTLHVMLRTRELGVRLNKIKKNIYLKFDQLIKARKRFEYRYSSQYKKLNKNVTDNCVSILFGRNSFQLGNFCPSLVDKLAHGYKQEKLLKIKPKNWKNFVSFELDEDGRLLRVKDVNSFGTVVETYIIRKNEIEHSIHFIGGKHIMACYDSIKATYKGKKLMRCDFISSNSIWSEIYDYQKEKNNIILCKRFHYVPGLKGSDNSVPIGEPSSPMEQVNIEIKTESKKNIIVIKAGEFIKGKAKMSVIYKGCYAPVSSELHSGEQMKNLNKTISDWLKIIKKEGPIPKSCQAIYIGLFENKSTYEIHFLGIKEYDDDDDDWACGGDSDYLPKNRYLDSKVATSEDWKLFLDNVKESITSIDEKGSSILNQVKHLAIGFDSGDLIRIR
jgi:hypothetical protein